MLAGSVTPQETAPDAPGNALASQAGAAAAPASSAIVEPSDLDFYKRLYDFGLGKRAYSYVSEYKRLPVYNFGLGKRTPPRMYSFGLGKRTPPRMYSFGLGKRGDLEDDGDDLDDHIAYDDADEEADGYEDEDATAAKRSRLYSFGLGKRARLYNFGLGKRAPAMYSFGLGKRDGRLYSFGLGKRPLSPDRRFSFGLGKRSADYEDDDSDDKKDGRRKRSPAAVEKRTSA